MKRAASRDCGRQGGGRAEPRPVVFLDRDGTLIADVGYLARPEQIRILPGVREGLRALRACGFCLVVLTNQSAVARGYIREKDLERLHAELRARLAKEGARIDAFYYCPHHPDEGSAPYRTACDCRKPAPGLAARAAADLGLALERAYVIGDKPLDMELAARIGAPGVLISTEKLAGEGNFGDNRVPAGARFVAADFREAADWVVRAWREREGRNR
jgi:D-glycero-D-manno-heptose 1,7-bisphosphate phosphatase